MHVPKLNDDEIAQHMGKLPGWRRDGDRLTKQYQFKDFIHSLQFVNLIGQTAEAVQHHPDIDVRYNKVILTLTTHDSGGITHNDIEMAASSDDFADTVGA